MEDPLVRAMAAAYRTSRGGAALQRRAGRDRRTYLSTWAGVPIVTTGRGTVRSHHKDEWVSVDELLMTCKLYAATAMYYCHGKDAHV